MGLELLYSYSPPLQLAFKEQLKFRASKAKARGPRSRPCLAICDMHSMPQALQTSGRLPWDHSNPWAIHGKLQPMDLYGLRVHDGGHVTEYEHGLGLQGISQRLALKTWSIRCFRCCR